MAEGTDFKFISVEDDDEEVVIQAGITASTLTSMDSFEDAGEAGTKAEAEPAMSDPGNQFAGGVCDEDDITARQAKVQDPEAEQIARHERERAKRQAKAQANRMITTEEDLKAKAPFAGMRRGIIIAAILILVVAALYFNMH